jgi:5'(3')-deoxyribonucleotidase/uncharacterized protein with PQ loop repeat
MSLEQWVAIIGTVAALCTTLAFVPQILKTWRTGGRDLSYGMLLAYLAGILLWLVYGILISRMAVIAANVAAILLVSLNLVLKRRAEGRALSPAGRPSRRLRVAIDMDETIADSLGKQIGVYNEAFGARLTPDDLDGQHLHELVPAAHADHARELFDQPDFFLDLDLIGGSREVIRDLASRHEVFIASAAMEVPTSFAAKYRWLREKLPFIPTSHLVFCGDKSVLDVDVLIDDTPRHFERFRGTPILFSAPHNLREQRYRRVSSWEEVRHLLLEAPSLDLERMVW